MIKLTLYDADKDVPEPPEPGMPIAAGWVRGCACCNSGVNCLFGWATGSGIVCGGNVPWTGSQGLGGKWATGWENWDCWTWGGGGIPTFIKGTPWPRGWKCGEGKGTNCCEWGAGTAGRNCWYK